ncbi:MAG: hypothetical protein FWB99_11015 [Treponema sp.]|nr:hypothetical protein [Treponema sp.]MCL2233590.1 hypothetical protein [Treponema sp.]
MSTNSIGNCYLCGTALAKSAMKNHILRLHGEEPCEEECYLLKVEGVYNKEYWLYVEVPRSVTLLKFDGFLRRIWLECCGHMSTFLYLKLEEIDMEREWKTFALGNKLLHHYDFGTTTETSVTIVGRTARKTPTGDIRLLARNTPPALKCVNCGKPAKYVGMGNFDPFEYLYCAKCCDKNAQEGEILLIPNSPRIGQCAYSGEDDCFAFDPGSVAGK